MFRRMAINMVSATTLLDQERSDNEDRPQVWAQKIDAQWKLRFEQCEPPT